MTPKERDALERDASGWLGRTKDDLDRGRLNLEALPDLLRAFAELVEEELTGPVDRGPGIGGVPVGGFDR